MPLKSPRLLAWRETDSIPANCRPYQRLVAAMLLLAVQDALAGDLYAVEWLANPGTVELALWIGLARWPPDLEWARAVMLEKWTQGRRKGNGYEHRKNNQDHHSTGHDSG